MFSWFFSVPTKKFPSQLATLTTSTRFSSDDHIVRGALQKSRSCAANVVCGAAVVMDTIPTVSAKDDGQGSAKKKKKQTNEEIYLQTCLPFIRYLTYDVREVVPR
jgi:hypothetical protein